MSGICRVDLVREVIRPALMALAQPKFKARKVIQYSMAAEQLLTLTAVIESNGGQYLRQFTNTGPGPALGIFQMEPATHKDILGNYLIYHDDISRAAKAAANVRHLHTSHLTYNLRYAAIMTRLHYARVAERLPEAGDPEWMVRYWKKYYNTPLGKGTLKGAMLKTEGLLSGLDAKALAWR